MYPFLIRTFHYFSLFTTLPVALVDIKMLTRRTVNVKDLIEDHTNFFRLWTTPHTTKGVSTAEGRRGHVTAYTMCTPSKIQMNGPDILNIDRSATE